jgi:hypothetical protein
MKPRANLVVGLLLSCLWLGACGPATPAPSAGFLPPSNPGVPSLVAHIQGANNVVSIYGWPQVAPPGTSRTFRIWAYTADGGVSGSTGIPRVDVRYGGSLIGSVTLDPGRASSAATIDWTPPSPPGDYSVEASVPGRLGESPDDNLSTLVCVQSLGVTIQDLQPQDGSSVCSPPPAPAPSTVAFSITGASASVTRIDCANAALRFDLSVSDAANQVAYAYVELANVAPPEGHAEEVIGAPGPGSTYTFIDTVPEATLQAELGSSAAVTWTARVVGYSGQMHSDGPHELAVTFPTCLAVSYPGFPLLPRLPDPFHGLEFKQALSAPAGGAGGGSATPTPLTCRKGTYYDPLSHVCNAKPTGTPKPGQKPPSCKSYSNASACTSNGCSWDKITNTCS